MPLPAPNLDDRTFQDILDEARRLIPQYCPEWTDHNLSDPGITLLELFAWMTDLLLFRLNRVPERNYVKFLDLIGLRLEPAHPATADVAFRLTAPQAEDVVIPTGTEVGTVRTEARESITFATDRDLIIRVPRLAHVFAGRGGTRFNDYQPALDDPRQGLGVFSDTPQPDDAFLLGFANDLSAHTLAITLRCRIEGIGVDPNDPPLIWESWDPREGRWIPVRLEEDTTGGLNRDGVVILELPFGTGFATLAGRRAFWVRCRVLRPRPGQTGYGETPRVTGVTVETLGAAVPCSHAFPVVGEILGTSDGTPGQAFSLQTLPVLPRRPEAETLEVEAADGTWVPWTEVQDFGASGERDRHFVLDDVSGTVELGPRIRTPDGRDQQYGVVPDAGRRLRFSRYRSGGGQIGNVGARTLTVLKSGIPYVAWVTNQAPATGGRDPEDVEHAKLRAPSLLRGRERAVTAADFEALALEASPAVTRARCHVVRGLGPATGGQGPGVVRLLLVPDVPRLNGPVPADLLQVSARVRDDVVAYLDERRLLTCEVVLEAPAYTWVSVVARLRAEPRADRERVAARTAEALYRYLHPSAGGPGTQGWPFGRELFISEIYTLLQREEGVDVVEEAAMYQVDPVTRTFSQPTNRIVPHVDGLVCSYEHRVQVQ
jgi:predicted phage baseplate assembly protein